MLLFSVIRTVRTSGCDCSCYGEVMVWCVRPERVVLWSAGVCCDEGQCACSAGMPSTAGSRR